MLASLAADDSIGGTRSPGFHLDEYVGMEITHGASFRKYLWERFVSNLARCRCGRFTIVNA
jgi:glucosamine-6-phosphate deaminase